MSTPIGKGIFIVEDDPIYVEAFSDYFSTKHGMTVLSFLTAEDAIEQIVTMRFQYDGIFMVDMYLGADLTGVDFVRFLRENGMDNNVIMLSGLPDKNIIRYSLQDLGVFSFVGKPQPLVMIENLVLLALDKNVEKPGCFSQRSVDGAVKYLLPLNGRYLEFSGLVLPGRQVPQIICVSSQTGCQMGCRFCATGSEMNQNVRNLTTDEMIQQVRIASIQTLFSGPVCVSVMGMGEPAENLDAVEAMIRRLHDMSDDYSFAVSTIARIGPLRNLVQRLSVYPRVELQVSIHFPDEELRGIHMPATRGYQIREIIQIAEDFSQEGACVNYTLFRGINHDQSRLDQLAELVSGHRIVVKLTKASPFGEYQCLTQEETLQVGDYLKKLNIPYRLFESKGRKVKVGCGEMAGRLREG